MLSLLIVLFLISIVFSFLCSMWEAVLLSVTPAYSRIQEEQGTAIGRQLRLFKDNIDKPLAAILTLNTIAHTVGAIGVGNQAAAIWADASPVITVLVVPTVMTLAILVLSEIIPKTLGATHWQVLAPFTVRSLRLIGTLMAPLVWMSQFITRRLKHGEPGSVLSRSDFLAMTDIVEEQGELHASESSIIKNLLRFQDVTASSVMTPRVVIVAAEEDVSIADFHASGDALRFSRIPCYTGGSMDQVTGYVLKDDVLEALLAGETERNLGSLKRPMPVIPEDYPIPSLFDRFLTEREHIALVVDRFGGTAGIVTSEDVIETLLGLEIVDERDESQDMQALARSMWRKRARRMQLPELPTDTPADMAGATVPPQSDAPTDERQ